MRRDRVPTGTSPRAARWPWLALVLVAASGGAWIGAEVTRRWPLVAAERFLERFSLTLRPIDPWQFRARVETPRSEAITATLGDRVFVFGGFHNAELQGTARVDVYDAAANRWQRLGDMPVPLTHANAVVRAGEIWIVGGFVGDHPGPATDQAWRYDPGADRWHPGPPLPEPRGGGGLALAPDGALHYYGGWLPDRRTDSPDHWRLGPGDSTWTAVAPLPMPRGHMGTATVAGHLYAVGGTVRHDPNPEDVDAVHRYDPRTDTWEEVRALPLPLSHTEPGTFEFRGRLYVVGGRSIPTGQWGTPDVWEYDPGSDVWTRPLGMPRGLFAPVATVVRGELFLAMGGEEGTNPRNHQSWAAPVEEPWRRIADVPVPMGEVAGGVIGDRLYLVGQGSSATLVLDLVQGSWRPVGEATQRPVAGHHHAAEVFGGEWYLLGGLRARSLDYVQVYSPITNRWRLGPPIPFPTGSAASAVIGSHIYVAGGVVDDTTTRQAARLDPVAGTWSPIAPMPLARNHVASATDGRRWYLFGGRGPGSGDANQVANGFAEVQVYDPETDSWTVSGIGEGAPLPLPQARGGMGKAVYANGEFYVLGGETLDGDGAEAGRVYSRVDIYDPVANQWRAGPRMPTPRHGIFPLRYGSSIWVAGGGIRAGGSASTVVEVLTMP